MGISASSTSASTRPSPAPAVRRARPCARADRRRSICTSSRRAESPCSGGDVPHAAASITSYMFAPADVRVHNRVGCTAAHSRTPCPAEAHGVGPSCLVAMPRRSALTGGAPAGGRRVQRRLDRLPSCVRITLALTPPFGGRRIQRRGLCDPHRPGARAGGADPDVRQGRAARAGCGPARAQGLGKGRVGAPQHLQGRSCRGAGAALTGECGLGPPLVCPGSPGSERRA